jgi:hypothetical protein
MAVRLVDKRIVKALTPIVALERDTGKLVALPKGTNVFLGIMPTMSSEIADEDVSDLNRKVDEILLVFDLEGM